MFACWNRSAFVQPTRRPQLQHDSILQFAPLQILGVDHSMSIWVSSRQPMVLCACFFRTKQENVEKNKPTVHGKMVVIHHWLQKICNFDLDSNSFAGFSLWSIDSSNYEYGSIYLDTQQSLMSLTMNETVYPVSWIAIVRVEVAPLERVTGTICKLSLHEVAVNTASALLVVSMLLICFFRISAFCCHCASLYYDACCIHLCHKFDWLFNDQSCDQIADKKSTNCYSWQLHVVLRLSSSWMHPVTRFQSLCPSVGIELEQENHNYSWLQSLFTWTNFLRSLL